MSCDHPQVYHVIDEHEGTIVCTNCAHVIHAQIYQPNTYQKQSVQTPTCLADFGSNNHFTSDVTYQAGELHKSKSQHFQHAGSMLKTAYVFLKACELCGCPRSISEIAQMACVSEAKLYFLQCKLNDRISPIKPEALLERAVYQLQYVTYSDIKATVNFIHALPILKTQSLAPKTVAAASLNIILQRRNYNVKHISIARAFNVNTKTIKRAVDVFLK